MGSVGSVYNWLAQYYILPCFYVLLMFAFLRKKFSKDNFRSLRLPPGPPAWPIVGNMLQLGALPHQGLAELARKYGPLMFIKLGRVHAVVVSSPEFMKEFLKTQDHIFSSRPASKHGEYLALGAQDMVWKPCNEVWRYMRKICTMELMSAKRIAQFEPVRREETFQMLERFLEAGKGEGLVQMDAHFTELGMNIMTRLLISKVYYGRRGHQAKDEGPLQFLQLMKDLLAIGLFIPGDFIPALAPLDLGGNVAKLKNVGLQFAEFFQGIMDEKRPNTTGIHDFLDVLLDIQKNKYDGYAFTDVEIKTLLLDLLIAGSDTKATTLAWLMAEVMRNPDVRFKLIEELDAVVGRDRLVRESDISQLKYLQAVVKENFRLHPIIPLLVPHESHEATKVAGYDIPNKTRVFFNIFAMGRDPRIWKNPLKFDPDRFLHSKIDLKGNDFELLPFGAGRRICVGLNLGLLLTEFTLAALLQTCDLALPNDMKPEDVDMEEIMGSTIPRKHPVYVLVKPRLPSHVYNSDGRFEL